MKRANILKILMVSQRDSCYRAHDEMRGTMLVPTLGGDKGHPNLQVQVEKQVCSSIGAADGARSWCPVDPSKHPQLLVDG